MILQDLESIALALGILVAASIAGLLLHFFVMQIITRLSKRNSITLSDSLVKHCRTPLRLIIPLLAIYVAMPLIKAPQNIMSFMNNILSLFIITSVAWLIIRLTSVIEDLVTSRYRIEEADNLQARKIHTQVRVINKILIVIIAIVALALVLMSFEKFRQVGAGILASAGVAGLIIGLAAQRTISNLLAGIQIALTQPIRIDDVVIVEKEWGWIEEITLTYVVVRIWDLRRLVLPISYFIEKPFQNWTRLSADILGTVYIYADYTVPVQEIREELHRILQKSEKWDSRVWGLQVTNATENTVELRALMSAADSSTAWDLRCEVRENLLKYIQGNYPNALPKIRAEIKGTEKTGLS